MRLMAVAFSLRLPRAPYPPPMHSPIRACSAFEPCSPDRPRSSPGDEFGRTRTRIMVQKRSYLDGGTEVMPADNINGFRSQFMAHKPSSALDRTAFDRPGWWSDPFFLPGKRNPYPWLGN